MNRQTQIALGTAVLVNAAVSIALAQNAPPTYQADPDVYKVIFENENFRVVLGTRKPRVKDNPHSHPIPSVTYFVTDCTNRSYSADGTTRQNSRKAGDVFATPLITSWHSAENIGSADCKELFIERK